MAKMNQLYAVLGKYNGLVTYRFPFVAAESEIEAKDMVNDYLKSSASDKDLARINDTEFFAMKRSKDGLPVQVLV